MAGEHEEQGRSARKYGAVIVGTGSYAPARVLSNADLEKMVETSDEWIRTRTGIRERRIAAVGETTADLAARAAERALADAGIPPEEIELIIVCTVTPNSVFPATACLVQAQIGASRAAAFDLAAGCSGFIYGLTAATQFLETGMYSNALVIGAETLSRITDWSERSTCVLFGDGAGAVVLRQGRSGEGVLANYLGADGTGGHFLQIRRGEERERTGPPGGGFADHFGQYIVMNGPEVFKFAVRIMAEAPLRALEKAGLDKHNVDYFIPHQANIRIIEAAARRLELPPERVYVNVDRYGNTSAASVPLALDEAVRAGKVKAGDIVVLVGFGAGLTWGATVLRWRSGER